MHKSGNKLQKPQVNDYITNDNRCTLIVHKKHIENENENSGIDSEPQNKRGITLSL